MMTSSTDISNRMFDRLVKLQTEATELLQKAILDERSRRWNKVIKQYREMLRMILKRNLPPGFRPSSNHRMLKYESYYHLGTALQNIGKHEDAVKAYTNAMNAMDLRKNGCSAGCNSNTCFHTPVLARRSFAYAHMADMKNAFRDIEKAIVLDSKNPDLYCVRALMWSTEKKTKKCLEDLNKGLSFNPRHTCSLLLRGSINQPLQANFLQGLSLSSGNMDVSGDHKMAIEQHPDASAFLDLIDIRHSNIIDFWNRFLWSLNVPRTVTYVDLTSSLLHQFKMKILPDATKSNIENFRLSSARTRNSSARLSSAATRSARAFRCGTATPSRDDVARQESHVRGRRLKYGDAVRCYNSNISRAEMSPQLSPRSAGLKFPGLKSPKIALSRSISSESWESLSKKRLLSSAVSLPINTTSSAASVTSPKQRGSKSAANPPSQRRRRSVATASSSVMTSYKEQVSRHSSAVYGIKVFNETRKAQLPRMYYKPWDGDKLPIGEKVVFPKPPTFRV